MRFGRTTGGVLLASLLLTALLPGPGRASDRPIGDTRVFAAVPDPGQPAGIVMGRGNVYVTTLGVAHHPLTDPKIFAFGLGDAGLRSSHTVPRDMAVGAMALYGAALDRRGCLYIVDMNGRIIRLDPRTAAQETYAHFPAAVGGLTTMPFDLVFDAAGNAYVTDQNLAGIWKVGPGGSPVELWFQDARLASYVTGTAGITLDPAGTNLYFTVPISAYPETAGQGLVFRLPLDDPSSETLEEVTRYPVRSSPFDLAFGDSGRLYVTLTGSNQISILRADGTEELRFPSAEDNAIQEVPYDKPMGLVFDGRGSLLVTNTSFLTNDVDHMVVFDVFVDDVAPASKKPIVCSRAAR